MNVTILGHVCIDRNESENSSYVTAGSPAVFINKIYQQLPVTKVSIIAPFGKDFLEYKKNLPLLDQSYLPEKTLIYENVSKNNTRSQRALNREYANPPDLTYEMIEMLRKTDILFIAPLLSNFSSSYLKEVFQYLKLDCLKVLLPQGYYRDFDENHNVIKDEFQEEEILSMVNLVIVSDEDGENIVEAANQWAKSHDLLVIVTHGKNGARAISLGHEINMPVSEVKEEDIVDTVGSGDIFSAAFAYKYYLTKDIEKSGRFANEIARQSLFFTPDEIKIDPNIV